MASWGSIQDLIETYYLAEISSFDKVYPERSRMGSGQG